MVTAIPLSPRTRAVWDTHEKAKKHVEAHIYQIPAAWHQSNGQNRLDGVCFWKCMILMLFAIMSLCWFMSWSRLRLTALDYDLSIYHLLNATDARQPVERTRMHRSNAASDPRIDAICANVMTRSVPGVSVRTWIYWKRAFLRSLLNRNSSTI